MNFEVLAIMIVMICIVIILPAILLSWGAKPFGDELTISDQIEITHWSDGIILSHYSDSTKEAKEYFIK